MDRSRLAGPVQKLRRVALVLGAIALLTVAGIVGRNVIVGGAGLLVMLAGMSIALGTPRLHDYLARNLPPGGSTILVVALGLLLVGLMESARSESRRPLLLVVVGLTALLVGALADGLVASRFRVGVAHRGLGIDQSRRWFDHSATRYQALSRAAAMIVVLLMALLAVAVVAARERAGSDVASGGLAAIILAIGCGLGGLKLASLVMVSRGSAAQRARLTAAIADYSPELLVHFSGSIRTLYQLGHWMPAIEATGRRALLVCRERATFEAAQEMVPWPTLLIEHYGDLDVAVAESVRVVFYVNTGTKNNHVIRFEEPSHVQLHHGESDKPPSGGKTMRLYDAHFVAGPAARARLEAAGVATGRIFEVGRPVTDGLDVSGTPPGSILYAPTWEGAHADSDLSSLVRFGEPLIAALLATGREVVFRPHPLTGTADPAMGAAMRRIAALVQREGGRVDDATEPLVHTFKLAGLLVADVSSVVVDWYAVDLPVLVTDIAGLGDAALWAKYPTTSGAAVIGPPMATLGALVEESFATDPMKSRRAAAATETLGEVGSAQKRFESALLGLIQQR